MSFLNITQKSSNWNSINWSDKSLKLVNSVYCSFGNYGNAYYYTQAFCIKQGGTPMPGYLPAVVEPSASSTNLTNYYKTEFYGTLLANPYIACGLQKSDNPTSSSNPPSYGYFYPNQVNKGISLDLEWFSAKALPDKRQKIYEYFDNFSPTATPRDFPTINN